MQLIREIICHECSEDTYQNDRDPVDTWRILLSAKLEKKSNQEGDPHHYRGSDEPKIQSDIEKVRKSLSRSSTENLDDPEVEGDSGYFAYDIIHGNLHSQ